MMRSLQLFARSIPAWSLCLGLAACTSTKLQPQAVDSPLPPSLAHRLTDSCLNKPLQKEGEQCWLIVQAAGDPMPPNGSTVFGSPTGLQVKASEVYRVQIETSQPFWYDATRQVPAPCGDEGSGFMKLMGFTKIHTQEQWFALMASVDTNCSKVPASCRVTENARALNTPEGHYTVPAEGQLVLYVNDTAGFYGNNQGRIRVTITLVTPHASPHTAHTASGSPP